MPDEIKTDKEGLVTVTVMKSWCKHRPAGLTYKVDPVRARHLLSEKRVYLGKPAKKATTKGRED